MARIRSIKPDFFSDDTTAVLHPDAQLLLLGLQTLADREGRLEDRPKKIRAVLFPYRDVDVETHLEALEGAGAVVRYESDGTRCIALPHFLRDQRPHPKETSFGLPPPPAVKSRETPRQDSEPSGRVPVVVGSGGGCGGGNGEKQSPTETAGHAEASPRQPPVASPRLPGLEPTPTAPEEQKPTRADHDFARWANAERDKVKPPTAPAESGLKKHQWAALGTALKDHGRKLLEAAFALYLGDDYARQQGFPLGLFASQWAQWVAKAQAAEAGARGSLRSAFASGSVRRAETHMPALAALPVGQVEID